MSNEQGQALDSVFQRLFDNFGRIVPLSDLLKNHLTSKCKVLTLKKRHLLLSEGDTCKNIYFIISGFARAYYFKEAKEITSWFMGEQDLIISVYSFFKQAPGSEYIQLLEDSVLISLTYAELQNIYRAFPEFNKIGRELTEYYYMKSEERTIGLRMLSAKERYDNLLAYYPGITQRASLGQIASYLGITQETLSRIRS